MVFDIGTMILQWQTVGIYDFLLPFLLMFALIFGILSTTNIIGPNKGLHIIIALVIALLAIGYNYSTGLSFSAFLQVLFPKMAIGLAALLCLLILIGLFVPEDERKYWLYGLGAIGAVIAIIAVSQSFFVLGWTASGYGDYAGWIVGAVLVVGVIIAVATSSGKSSPSKDRGKAVMVPWWPDQK
jgi:hypothetical protein